MNFRIIAIITLILFVYTTNIFSLTKQNSSYILKNKKQECSTIQTTNTKSPFIAGILSFTWTGTGHIYIGDYEKGTFFLTIDLLQKAIFVYLLIDINNKYTEDDGIISWQELSITHRISLISILMSFFVVKIWDTYLAIKDAKIKTKNTNIKVIKSDRGNGLFLVCEKKI